MGFACEAIIVKLLLPIGNIPAQPPGRTNPGGPAAQCSRGQPGSEVSSQVSMCVAYGVQCHLAPDGGRWGAISPAAGGRFYYDEISWRKY